MARKWRLFSGRVRYRSFLKEEDKERRSGQTPRRLKTQGNGDRWEDRILPNLPVLIPFRSAFQGFRGKRLRRLLIVLLSALLGLAFSLTPVWSSVPPETQAALELARLGRQRYSLGQLGEAARLWQQAAEAYRQAGDREGTQKSLINRSQALQDLGLDAKACDTLLQAFAIDTLNCTSTELDELLGTLQETVSLTEAIGLRSLGNVLRRRGLLDSSQAFLQLSLSAAAGTPEESATLLSLGNTERALGNRTRDRWDYERVTEIIDNQSQQAALSPYQEAFKAYSKATAMPSASPDTKIEAQLNQMSLFMELQSWWSEQTARRVASWNRLDQPKLSQRAEAFASVIEAALSQEIQALQDQIQISLPRLSLNRASIYARLNFARSLIELEQIDRAESLLEIARKQARFLQDSQAESYALGYLGQLYSQQHLDKAIQLTRQALLLAQEQSISGDAREIAYLWQSQLGSLLREQGDMQGAIASYIAAYNTLQSLRTDLNANNQDVQFDFRQEVKPVYMALADLLLQSNVAQDDLNLVVKGNAKENQAKSQDRLTLARRVIESLQLAELDNFFQDPCVEEVDVAVQIDDLDAEAAVIYPIVLQDRLEVLLSLPGQPLREAAIPVSEAEVNRVLDELYDTLDNPTASDSARNILLTANPEAGELEENLQKLLPLFTQVYDWLIRPFESQLDLSTKTLAFVLNGRLQKVPMAALYDGSQYLLEKYSIGLVPSLQLVAPKTERQPLRVLAAGVSEPVAVRGENFPALINVPEELAQIESAFPRSQMLLNEEFTATSLQDQLKADFPVVHLATHAQFSSDPQKNFIVTGQGSSIDIEQLSELLRDGDNNRPELLVLSACQTATGDEQAILGLAGVAVRSGARSTLATLWPVEDASTAQLMGQFYQQLKEPGVNKTSALRSAQLSLLESLQSNSLSKGLQDAPPHPYYWAPYVLVGNWQ